MSDLITEQLTLLRTWAGRAIETGWLSADAPQALDDVTLAAPEQLFGQTSRPLVTGFFGGTGAGKSSLLNRLAAEPVARASAERPTSRSITVYVHRSTSVDKLPEHLPLHRVRTAIHNNELYRQIMFVDMPDFDSVETENRTLVEQWLPHMDILLYVVSPERYRDDQGWRLLQRHAQQHAWAFVMNHWDKASEQQLHDFKRQLQDAGLTEPVLFRTICSPDVLQKTFDTSTTPDTKDDFLELQQMLTDLANQSIISALNQHGLLARLRALKSISDQWVDKVDQPKALADLGPAWSSYWQTSTASLEDSMHWSFAQHASGYAQSEPLLQRLLRRRSTPSQTTTDSTNLQQSAEDRVDTLVEHFINESSQERGLPVAALRQALTGRYEAQKATAPTLLQDSLNRELISPGSAIARRLYKALNVMCWLLPIAAMIWIAYRVVAAFIDGGSNPAQYLGSNFAVNGALLLLFAWLIPASMHAMLTPTREQSALRGLKSGFAELLGHTDAAINLGISDMASNGAALASEYRHLWTELPALEHQNVPDQIRRLIVDEMNQSSNRRIDVRATTQSSTDDAPVS